MTLFLKTKQGYAKRSTLKNKHQRATWFVKKWLHNENQEVESVNLKSYSPSLNYQTQTFNTSLKLPSVITDYMQSTISQTHELYEDRLNSWPILYFKANTVFDTHTFPEKETENCSTPQPYTWPQDLVSGIMQDGQTDL